MIDVAGNGGLSSGWLFTMAPANLWQLHHAFPAQRRNILTNQTLKGHFFSVLHKCRMSREMLPFRHYEHCDG
jgi:hypothetical protein